MSEAALIVINPNASQAVTDGIDRAVEPLRALGLPIRCVTLAEVGIRFPGTVPASDAEIARQNIGCL